MLTLLFAHWPRTAHFSGKKNKGGSLQDRTNAESRSTFYADSPKVKFRKDGDFPGWEIGSPRKKGSHVKTQPVFEDEENSPMPVNGTAVPSPRHAVQAASLILSPRSAKNGSAKTTPLKQATASPLKAVPSGFGRPMQTPSPRRVNKKTNRKREIRKASYTATPPPADDSARDVGPKDPAPEAALPQMVIPDVYTAPPAFANAKATPAAPSEVSQAAATNVPTQEHIDSSKEAKPEVTQATEPAVLVAPPVEATIPHEAQLKIHQQQQEIELLRRQLRQTQESLAAMDGMNDFAGLAGSDSAETWPNVADDETRMSMANRMSNLGMRHHTRGNLDLAIRCYKMALKLGSKLSDKGSPQSVASRAITQSNLGFALLTAGYAMEAAPYLDATLALAKATENAPNFIQTAGAQLHAAQTNAGGVVAKVPAPSPSMDQVMLRLRTFLDTFRPADFATSLPPTVPASAAFLRRLQEFAELRGPQPPQCAAQQLALCAPRSGRSSTAAKGMPPLRRSGGRTLLILRPSSSSVAVAASQEDAPSGQALLRLVAPSSATSSATHNRLRAMLKDRVIAAAKQTVARESNRLSEPSIEEVDSRSVDDLLAYVEGSQVGTAQTAASTAGSKKRRKRRNRGRKNKKTHKEAAQ